MFATVLLHKRYVLFCLRVETRSVTRKGWAGLGWAWATSSLSVDFESAAGWGLLYILWKIVKQFIYKTH